MEEEKSLLIFFGRKIAAAADDELNEGAAEDEVELCVQICRGLWALWESPFWPKLIWMKWISH